MKISELMEKLGELQGLHGDIEVECLADEVADFDDMVNFMQPICEVKAVFALGETTVQLKSK